MVCQSCSRCACSAGVSPGSYGDGRLTLPVWIAAPLAGFTILLYGRASGETHFQFLLIHITDGSISLAIATVLRMLAIALPAIVLFVTLISLLRKL